MKKIVLMVLVMVMVASLTFAADVNLRWDPVTGATGYKIYMSTDNCATWQTPKDVGNVLIYTYTAVPDTGLIHFKVSAYKAGGIETVSHWMGAWWDSTKMPLGNPVALGTK